MLSLTGLIAGQESKGPELIKNFNEVNDDGTYVFGYEASDGTFKIESKDLDGIVTGKDQKTSNVFGERHREVLSYAKTLCNKIVFVDPVMTDRNKSVQCITWVRIQEGSPIYGKWSLVQNGKIAKWSSQRFSDYRTFERDR